MKEYVSPIIIPIDDVAEGVYMASGSIQVFPKVTSIQDFNGSSHVFEVSASLSGTPLENSERIVVNITFNSKIVSAFAMADSSFSGNVVTVICNASTLQSGVKVFVEAEDQTTTTSLSCIDATIGE